MARIRYIPQFKENIGGLDVIQSIYAFAMALGLQEVFLASRTFVLEILFGPGDGIDLKAIVIFLLLVNIVVLGLRFFWVPRNLRGLIFTAVKSSGATTGQIRTGLRNWEVSIHLLMIFLHGGIFYFLCLEFEHIAFVASSNMPVTASTVQTYAVIHIVLLLVNAFWISMIQQRENSIRASAARRTNASATAGSVWWRNNMLCGLLAFALLAVFSSCGSAVEQCLANVSGETPGMSSVLPLSALQIGATINAVLAAVQSVLPVSVSQELVIPVIVLLILLANSLFDLGNTGATYLLLEEVDWHEVPEDEAEADEAEPEKADGP